MVDHGSLVFHHVGLLTDQPEIAARRLRQLGYHVGPRVSDRLQLTTLQLCIGPAGSATIELVTPHTANEGLGRLLKRRGDYMYHVCFATQTFEGGLKTLSVGDDDRITVVSPPTPAVLFDGALVAFYLVSGLGLVELVEKR